MGVKTLGICTDTTGISDLSNDFSGHRWGGYRVTVDTQGMSVTKYLQTQRGELDSVLESACDRISPAACQINDGGAFFPDGTLYSNCFPMEKMTEAAGFGGIRRVNRGADNLNVGDSTVFDPKITYAR